ncbi:MAG: arabinofuranosidase catalytic domain-containing protein [Polyangiaceae bacterium]
MLSRARGGLLAAVALTLGACGTAAPTASGDGLGGSGGSVAAAGEAPAHSGAGSTGVSGSIGAAGLAGSTSSGGSFGQAGSSSQVAGGGNAGASGASGSNDSASGASGSFNTAGSAGMGGAGTGGSSGSAARTGPCDIYESGKTPCAAAHSTVRALYGAFSGSLYQVRRASDKTTKDVPVLEPLGFANASVQDSFCSDTTCTISIIYDQSPNGNHLKVSPVAHWLPNGGKEANATSAKVTLSGQQVYGVYVAASAGGTAYRNNGTKGIATGDQPESMYMVVDGKRFNNQCCFDYGNAETTGNDDGNATMEAVYWGSDTTWGGKGDGSGPWVAADLENGVFKFNKGGWQSQSLSVPNAKSVIATYATAMLKGPSGNKFGLKGGNAQAGALVTMWNGARPSGYSPMKKKGAIILGTGGDGSPSANGTFFEGCMTSGNPSDEIDDAVQANIVAAYGH